VIGGGLGLRFGERYMEPLLEEMRKHVFFETMPKVEMASLGDLGGAIGASLLVNR
jgi:glucokinase